MHQHKTISIGLGGTAWLLTTIFFILKLTGVIDWAWWLVFLPVIVTVGLSLFIAILAFLVIGIGISFLHKYGK